MPLDVFARRPRSRDRRTNRNVQLDAHRLRVGRRNAEADARAVGDAGRQRNAERVRDQRFARAFAAIAELRPGFAASPAIGARRPERHFDGNDLAARRLAPRQRNLSHDRGRLDRLAKECVAHPLDGGADRRKVDRDLVCKALVRHEGLLTIEVDPDLVKAGDACYNRGEPENITRLASGFAGAWHPQESCPRNRVRCAAAPCGCVKSRPSYACRAIQVPARELRVNGSVLTAITSRKPKKIGEEPCESRRERASARANRQ